MIRGENLNEVRWLRATTVSIGFSLFTDLRYATGTKAGPLRGPRLRPTLAGGGQDRVQGRDRALFLR
jgi:hypothetical protein